ncbi:lipopolysaccharide core biosynthesis protein RfaZ [Kluyvera genomosp. 3]|uniref:Lipopolysaccharide core biosynthesis protein RfaZ n=1 Tax=Kluyvera genomosp. 3 TaxID=2774055 RepID=A0A6G9RMX9_9ENTR|nr:lipopolysaccharide core biosynthesis protein RfaZ [Kluyvera genomosp. 3]QIR27299.1 lipopolysaccharide core biosynthesis protein RfaZ [Kluyvera genomosp. 3]
MMAVDNLSKWFYKTLYRTTHPRQYQHNKNLWPFFRVVRNASGGIENVFFKHREINMPAVHKQTRNKPLLIMATGPSVNHIETRFFNTSFDYFGVNGAFSMEHIDFKWYAITDRNFVRGRLSLVKALVSQEDLTVFCPYTTLETIFTNIEWRHIRCRFKIFEAVSGACIYKFLGAKENVVVNDEHYHWLDGAGFSDNIDRALFDYGTVVYPALQIACALGYREIYIAGLDMNNFEQPRFYETAGDKLGTRLDRDFEQIRHSFYAAQSYCALNNIRVVNLSPESAIDAFPKLSWAQINRQAS